MNLPPPLLKAAKVIVGNLSEAERQEFFEAIAAAARGKDLSVVHWQFLSAELRALPDDLPERIQALVDEVIAGMNRIAAGKAWHDAAKVAKAAFAADTANVTFVAYAAYAGAISAVAAKELYTTDVADAASFAANAAAFAAPINYINTYIKARRRQRDTFLALVKGAPDE